MKYDDRKMQELILYIADRQKGDGGYGRVKMAKLLFYSDFEAFARLGAPVTGATYIKRPQGPLAKEFLPAQSRLLAAQDLREDAVEVGPYTQYRLVALRDSNLEVFSPEEIAVVDEVIHTHEGWSGKEISDKSHEELVWDVPAMDSHIPYSAYLVSAEPADPELIERAHRIVKDENLVSASAV
jgi:hypothetical protein